MTIPGLFLTIPDHNPSACGHPSVAIHVMPHIKDMLLPLQGELNTTG